MAERHESPGHPFEALRRRAAAVQAAVARGEHDEALRLVRPVGPFMVELHRAGHRIVAQRLDLGEAASEPNAQKACSGVSRLVRTRVVGPDQLAVICAGQAAECLALGLRFQRKVWLCPDLKLALAMLRRRGVADPEREVQDGWTLARRLLRARVDDIESALTAPLRRLADR